MKHKKYGQQVAMLGFLVALFCIGGMMEVSPALAYPSSSMALEFITTGPNETAEVGFGGNLQGVTIEWGDGTPAETISDGLSVPDAFYTHVYAAAGTYVAVISGTTLGHFGRCASAPNNWNLKRVLNWGHLNTSSLACAAYSRTALTSVPTNIPSTVTDISYMFFDASVFNQDLSTWDTSNVTMMAHTFGHSRTYNQSLGDWRISNVTNLDYIFDGSMAFGNAAYSATLIGWASQRVHSNLMPAAILAQATGCSAIEARNTLITQAHWSISDTAPTQVCAAQTAASLSTTGSNKLPAMFLGIGTIALGTLLLLALFATRRRKI